MTWLTWNACGLLVIGLYAAFSLMTAGDAVSGAWLGVGICGVGTYLELRMSIARNVLLTEELEADT